MQTTVDNIEDLLLSRQPENLDNYTLAVIFVNKVYQNPEKRKRIKKIVMITVIVVIAAIVIGVVPVSYTHLGDGDISICSPGG